MNTVSCVCGHSWPAPTEPGFECPKCSTPTPDSAGWIEWRGGECPVDVTAFVDVKFGSGEVLRLQKAGHILWGKWTSHYHYRVDYYKFSNLPAKQMKHKSYTLKLSPEQLWYLREIYEAAFTDPESMNNIERGLQVALSDLSAKAQRNRK